MVRLRRYRHLVLVLALGVLLAGAGTPGETPAPPAASLQEVTVIGVFNDQRGQHGVMLEGKRDKRRFLMLIGAAEATAIAVPLENITPPRPLTHDLFLTLFGRLKVTVTRVVVTDLKDGIYYATIFLDASGREIQLDSRPSDAIALAIRAKAPVLVEDRVFDKSDILPGAPSAPRI